MTFHVFLIGTEHQYFQVEEAIRHFNLNINICILIFEDTKKEYTFISKINENKKFNKIFIFNTWAFKDVILNNRNSRYFIEICNKIKSMPVDIHFYASDYDKTLHQCTINS